MTTSQASPILGLKVCNVLGLVIKGEDDSEKNPEINIELVHKGLTEEKFRAQYQDVFTRLGKFSDTCHMQT